MARADVELLLEALAADRGLEAVIHHDRRLTRGQLADEVHRTARVLERRGLRPGDMAVLIGDNEPEMLVARWAANLLGAGVTQPYSGLSDTARGRIVDDVEARLVLVAPGHDDEAARIRAHARPVPALVLDADLTTGVDATPVPCGARPDDVEQIRHTGGTTGHPKGITYTFAHHLRRPERPVAVGPSPTGPRRQLIATTIAHMAGYAADATLQAGGAVVLLDGFDPDEVLATIAAERITDLWLLPPLLHRLLDAGDPPGSALDGTDTSSLRTVVYGGAPAVPARIAEAVDRIGPVFVQFYGQTEAGGISMLTPEEHRDPDLLRTVGRVLPGTELDVRDAEGTSVPDGEVGELWVRTGTAMDGYWKQPELTARTLTVDGWVRTGDVGHLDTRGYLHIDDRLGDVVIVVGGHVHTHEVENVLVEHPGVREAAVYGAPGPDGSETVHAAVVASPDGADPDELIALVTRRLGAMYAPSRVDVVDALPLTDPGKVDKKALRDAEVSPASG